MSQSESDEQRARVVRTEQPDQNVALEGKEAAFALDRPEAIPKLHVPGLSPDATSVPPEALRGEVPTLTESVSPEALAAPEPTPQPTPEPTPEPIPAAPHLSVVESVPEPVAVHVAPEPALEAAKEEAEEPVADVAPPVAQAVAHAAPPPPAPAEVAHPAPAQASEPSIHNVEDVDMLDSPEVKASLPTVVPELQEDNPDEALPEASALQEEATEEPIQAPMEATWDEEAAQELPSEADTWAMQMQVRMEKLTEEISLLNDRLDRFEKLPKV